MTNIRPDIRYPALTGHPAGYPVSGFWISRISGKNSIGCITTLYTVRLSKVPFIRYTVGLSSHEKWTSTDPDRTQGTKNGDLDPDPGPLGRKLIKVHAFLSEAEQKSELKRLNVKMNQFYYSVPVPCN
jgi:hypothetical protein